MASIQELKSKTKIIQVSNIAPQSTKDKMSALFGYLGKIEDIRLYPTIRDVAIPIQSRICFIRFQDRETVLVSQHMTDTVFIDRALVVIPYASNEMPDEKLAMDILHSNSAIPGLATDAKWPTYVTNHLDVKENIIRCENPKLAENELPEYPNLPSATESHKVNEIRRTVIFDNLHPDVKPDEVIVFAEENAGNVKFLKMGKEKDGTINCLVEFAEFESVIPALLLQGRMFKGLELIVNHSIVPISKPRTKSNEEAQNEIEESMKKVKDSQSALFNPNDPLCFINSNDENSRSRSRSRSRHSRSKSRSKKRRTRSISRRRSRSTSRSRRHRSRSRRPSRSKRSASKHKHSRRKSRSRSRSRSKTSRSKRSRSRSRRDKEKKDKDKSKEKKESKIETIADIIGKELAKVSEAASKIKDAEAPPAEKPKEEEVKKGDEAPVFKNENEENCEAKPADFDKESVKDKSPEKDTKETKAKSRSRSPGRSKKRKSSSRSPSKRRKSGSRSPSKRRSKSRRRSRSRERDRKSKRRRSRSGHRRSRSRSRRKSRDRRRSRTPRRRSRSLSRTKRSHRRSRSRDRRRSKSKDRRRRSGSRSKDRRRSRSKDRRSKSRDRRDRKRSRSRDRKRSRSRDRKRSRSRDRKRSRSVDKKTKIEASTEKEDKHADSKEKESNQEPQLEEKPDKAPSQEEEKGEEAVDMDISD